MVALCDGMVNIGVAFTEHAISGDVLISTEVHMLLLKAAIGVVL